MSPLKLTEYTHEFGHGRVGDYDPYVSISVNHIVEHREGVSPKTSITLCVGDSRAASPVTVQVSPDALKGIQKSIDEAIEIHDGYARDDNA